MRKVKGYATQCCICSLDRAAKLGVLTGVRFASDSMPTAVHGDSVTRSMCYCICAELLCMVLCSLCLLPYKHKTILTHSLP